MKRLISLMTLCALFAAPAVAQHDHSDHGKKPKAKGGACCSAPTASKDAETVRDLKVPDVPLINQFGEQVRLKDLMANKVVALNFIFTTCKTICPPMGANFTALKHEMGDHVGNDLAMISISIDPVTDTPERLKNWSDKFNPGPGWTLLTGEKRDVDAVLKALNVFTALKEDHAPIIMVGRDGSDEWVRANGLAEPQKLAALLNEQFKTAQAMPAAAPAPADAPAGINPDLHYFTDVKLVDQNGDEMRLYSDLMKDKVVIINPFFSECTGSCLIMNDLMKEVQAYYGDKIGKDVVLMSITVDPTNDTPQRLMPYAQQYDPKSGWHFLTGDKANVDIALRKLGKYVADRETHDTILLIGNMNTRLWKKANALSPAEEVIKVIDSVVYDQG